MRLVYLWCLRYFFILDIWWIFIFFPTKSIKLFTLIYCLEFSSTNAVGRNQPHHSWGTHLGKWWWCRSSTFTWWWWPVLPIGVPTCSTHWVYIRSTQFLIINIIVGTCKNHSYIFAWSIYADTNLIKLLAPAQRLLLLWMDGLHDSYIRNNYGLQLYILLRLRWS